MAKESRAKEMLEIMEFDFDFGVFFTADKMKGATIDGRCLVKE